MAKKRILFVVEAMGGGVFTYIVDLANKLVDDYDMYIAYAIRPQTPKDYKSYFDKRIHLIRVKHFARKINLINDVKAIIEIRRIAKTINPDIIHLHSSKAGVVGRIAFSGSSVPVFYTPHGYSFLMQDYNSSKRLLFKMIESVFAKRNCTTISCSIGEHKETLKMTKRATYINNGINTAELDDVLKDVNIHKHPYTVFTLGRICYQKNPRLFNLIASSMPNTRFLWIGDGELRNELKSSNIEITGWVDRKTALQLSMNADAFVLTSLWEGLPISLLEAMYMKKICVVSDVIGNHDVIKSGQNGFVCSSPKDFIRALTTERNDTIINNAYNDILKRYNTKVMAEKYARFYESRFGGKQDEENSSRFVLLPEKLR